MLAFQCVVKLADYYDEVRMNGALGEQVVIQNLHPYLRNYQQLMLRGLFLQTFNENRVDAAAEALFYLSLGLQVFPSLFTLIGC